MRKPLGLYLAIVVVFLETVPAVASHYANERARSGILTEREARLEVRRVLRQRGFAGAVTSHLKQNCHRQAKLRIHCRYSRNLNGGNYKLRGSGVVYVLSASSGALLRYRLDTTVTLAPPCEGSATRPCVSRFHFTYANHQRVSSSG